MTTATVAATRARQAIGDVLTGRALLAFYIAVLGVALVGSGLAAQHWLKWWLPFAFGAVALYELGGVALSIFADRRRQLGERALAARLLSFAFAAGGVAVNLFGHVNAAGQLTGPGYFFAGFSAAAYCVYLLDSAAKRRDALRALAKLPERPPAYGLYQWLRHPGLTYRARALAVTNAERRLVERLTSLEQNGHGIPTTELLGRAASLAQAAADVRRERRVDAIRGALRARIARGVDPTMATIAVNTYDLDKLAEGIADAADYGALTGLLAAELTPGHIAAGVKTRRERGWFGRKVQPQTQEIVAALTLPAAPETPETPETDAPVALETVETPAPVAAPQALPVVPADARLLPIRCAVSLLPTSTLEPVPPAPRAPETIETGPEPVETTAPDAVDLDLADAALDPADEPDPQATEAAARLAQIPERLLPHLVKVMQARRDWHLTINLHGKHPDALTHRVIKDAIGMTGQQLSYDIKTALLDLRHHHAAVEAHLGIPQLADAHA